MLSNFLKKLIFARQFAMVNGKIEVLGERYVSLHNKILIRAVNGEDITNYVKLQTSQTAKKLGILKGPEFVKYFKDFFETMGFGGISIVDLDTGKKRAIIRLHESAIARAYISEKIETKIPVCNLPGQVMAGMLSYVFGKNVKAEEKDCIALGKDVCQFVIK